MIRILHHHLRRGGVTRVMVLTACILRDAGEEVELLAGEPPPEPLPEGIGFRLIPGMGYHDAAHPTDAESLFETLSGLYEDGDVWHIHNHSLGKNPAVTDAWIRLAEHGQRVVFQPHDFAEDGRPGNLTLLRDTFPGFPDRLYPYGEHVRYAVLQTRDRQVLVQAGIPKEHVHLLPNPVAEEAFAPPQDPPNRILYLTRAIRRTNMGEFLYWARQLGDTLEFATSLLPENPVELKLFETWQAFAAEKAISVSWGIGASGRSFQEVVEWGDVCITTSVGEGFGLSFLEPYAMARSVTGRNLPEITAGFQEDGVDLSQLYETLPVPVDAVDASFWERAGKVLTGWRVAMGSHEIITREQMEQAWVVEGQIDFGRLDEPAQQAVISSGTSSTRTLSFSGPDARKRNALAIREAYSPAQYLKRLNRLYEAMGTPEALSFVEGDRVRDVFLNLEAIFLLRT